MKISVTISLYMWQQEGESDELLMGCNLVDFLSYCVLRAMDSMKKWPFTLNQCFEGKGNVRDRI